MAELAPNLSYHYWLLGINPEPDVNGTNTVLVKGSEFEHGKEIEFQDDEGHTGTATTKMSSYRSKAYSAPSFTDKTRYKEGWEDMWMLLLGSDDETEQHAVRKVAKNDEPTVFDYTFKVNSANPQDPKFCTIYNGFAKTTHDAFLYENCLLNELEITFSNEEAMTYKPTFSANFPQFNQQNPARVLPKTSVFTKTSDVSIYIAPYREQGYTEEEMLEFGVKYGCFIEGTLNVNNNVEDQPCAGDEFGTSTKVLGNREATFNLTLPWTSQTKKLEYQFMGGADDATKVVADNDYKTVWIILESDTITKESEGQTVPTNYKYKTVIKIPEINMTVANSPQGGSDAKQLELEGNIMENGTDSFIETIITTDLPELHMQPANSP